MKLWFSPTLFNNIAISVSEYRWTLLGWSLFAFLMFALLQGYIGQTTPESLVWLAIFILFFALQALVLAAFIFFFQVLPSSKVQDKTLQKFYKSVEWCEAAIFGFILPVPTLLFIYAYLSV